MTQEINKKIAKGSIWMIAMRFSVKGIGLISTLILVRLLSPDDFGVMGLAMTVYAFIQLMNAFGFDSALIQNQNATDDHYNTAWTIRIIFSSVSCVLLLMIAKWAAGFYNDPRLEPVLYVMALLLLLNSFRNVGIVEFRKNMVFGREYKYQVLIKVCAFCVTIPMAWYLQSYWALIAGMLATSVAGVILSYGMHRFRPRFSLSKWRDLFSFSSWLFLNNILFFINHQSQNIILGRVSDTRNVGLFTVSSEVGTITTNELVAPVNRATFPGYAKLSSDLEKLKDTYLGVLGHILMIALPCNIGIAAIAPLLVPVVIGEDWVEMIPVLQFIALASIFSSINTNSGYVYLALAKQKITTVLMIVRLCIFLPLLYFLAKQFGAVGAGMAMLVTTMISFPISQVVLKSQINLTWSDLFSVMRRPTLSALLMGVSVHYLIILAETSFSVSPVLLLVASTIFGTIVFLVTLYGLWLGSGKNDGVEKTLIRIAIEQYRKRIQKTFTHG